MTKLDVKWNVKKLGVLISLITITSLFSACNESGVGGGAGGGGGGPGGGGSIFSSSNSAEPVAAINQVNDSLNNNNYALDQADVDLLQSENLLDESDPNDLQPFVNE